MNCSIYELEVFEEVCDWIEKIKAEGENIDRLLVALPDGDDKRSIEALLNKIEEVSDILSYDNP